MSQGTIHLSQDTVWSEQSSFCCPGHTRLVSAILSNNYQAHLFFLPTWGWTLNFLIAIVDLFTFQRLFNRNVLISVLDFVVGKTHVQAGMMLSARMLQSIPPQNV